MKEEEEEKGEGRKNKENQKKRKQKYMCVDVLIYDTIYPKSVSVTH